MDTVIPALIIAAISAVTIVAYKHPNAFGHIFILLAGCFVAMYSAQIAWDSGIRFTYRALLGFIEHFSYKHYCRARQSAQG